MNTALNISSGPHARDKWTTSYIMHVVILSLLPTVVIGVIANGLHALMIILSSVIAAVLSEFVFDKLCHKKDTWKDGSAVITGLMLALCLSPSVPLYIPILGSMFAILVVKCCFGGLGKNFINPALAARCFLLISFGTAMTRFEVDGVSTATPIADLIGGNTVNITKMFLGFTPGVIGSSALALLVGGLVLWALDIIHGEICFSVLGGFTLFLAIFGGRGFDPRFLAAHICGGGVVMGAFFMATDYATSPVSKLGQFVYGTLIGVLGAIFRLYGGTTDSFSYSVIIGNLFVPLIDMYIIAKPFAYRRTAERKTGQSVPLLKRVPRPVIVLTAITLIAGLALSGVYAMTKDTIDEQKRAANAASYGAVVPEAVNFESSGAIDKAIEDLNGQVYGSDFGRAYINEAYIAKDADGNTVGYAISATSSDGFDGNVSLAVGLNAEGVLNGISFTELNETPGMGMRVDEPAFKDQFAGRSVTKFTLNKAGGSTEDDQIDSVSGASTTSGAVVNAVNAALDFFHSFMKGGN
ncbi:MAG: RnfABCDGE type electron transport complex subunit D [Clostridia bacterium]|nr:RnfABCDGE type electron transport complex subunit D [Clostridia bacterium]